VFSFGLPFWLLYKFTLAAVLWQVCRKFKQVFEQNPELSRWMVLPEAFAASSLPSLLKWLHLFGSAVQGVSCTFNAAAQAVLTLLSWPGSHIHTIHIRSASSLTTFDLLQNANYHPCDLSPLQALPNLNSLYLRDGVFQKIHTLAHLTELRLSSVHLEACAVWACCTSLKQAHLHGSYVDGLHPQGLVVCSNLEEVSIVNSTVSARDRSQRFDLATPSSPQIPRSLSRLTNLHRLHLEMNRPKGHDLYVPEIYQLVSLAHLSYKGYSALHLELGLSQLTNLVCLSLSSHCRSILVHISFAAIDWQKLYSLQRLILRECKLSFDASILTIVEHQRMQTIMFDGCIPADQHTSKFYADLVYTLALRRPDIKFSAVMLDI